jgi:hypothetical protein
MEYREGAGLMVFCQMEVTGRNDPDPAAAILAQNLIAYVASWKPAPRRTVLYAGDDRGKQHLEATGITAAPYDRAKLTSNTILVAAPGSGTVLAPDTNSLEAWLKAGGKLLAIGLGQEELNSLLPGSAGGSPASSNSFSQGPISTTTREHISAYFEPFPFSFGTTADLGCFTGINPGDLLNHDPRNFPLISGGARIFGDGALAQTEQGNIVLCQIAPWDFTDDQPNLKRTHRRVSFLLSRLLANLGATSTTPLLERFHDPVTDPASKNRCLAGLYLDTPEEWDDPYRHFRW